MDKEEILALADSLVNTWSKQGKMPPMAWNFRGLCVAAIESYKAELLKEVGEPVAEVIESIQTPRYFYVKQLGEYIPKATKLFTSNQVAAAVLRAEQRVAEAISQLCYGGNGMRIRRQIAEGEYRKFMKGE